MAVKYVGTDVGTGVTPAHIASHGFRWGLSVRHEAMDGR